MGDIFKTEPCCFLAQLRRFLHLCTFQARDVCEAGVIHQGAPRDVHGHRGLGGEPGGDGEQVEKVVLLTKRKIVEKSCSFDGREKSSPHQNRRPC